MNHPFRRLAALLLAAAFLTPAALAADKHGDEAFREIAETPEANGCFSTQGMAAGASYVYSIQVNGDDSLSVVHRVDPVTGQADLMKYEDTRRTYFRNLRHANGIDVHTIDGVEYLFAASAEKLVMFRIDDDHLYQVGEYDITYNGSPFSPSGLSVYKVDRAKIRFLFRSGYTVSLGEIARGAEDGEIPVSVKCNLDVTRIPLDGEETDLSDFLNQGFCYRNNILYIVIAGCAKTETMHQSAILGYNISDAKGRVQPEPELVFFIGSDRYRALFEIEDCDLLPDGRMVFNANRRLSDYDTNHDGVMMLDVAPFSAEPAPDTTAAPETSAAPVSDAEEPAAETAPTESDPPASAAGLPAPLLAAIIGGALGGVAAVLLLLRKKRP